MNVTSWLVWATILFLQNISFTYVSRARSSGSLLRHLKASIFSNGIWIFSQIIMLGVMFDNLTGKHGLAMQLSSAGVYTMACVSGSIFAHWLAMKTEKGKNAVGYNKKYAQIPVEEWARVQSLFADIASTPQGAKLIMASPATADTLQEVAKEWAKTKEEVGRAKDIAGQAYDICLGIIPDSRIRAAKVAGEVVTTGLPNS